MDAEAQGRSLPADHPDIGKAALAAEALAGETANGGECRRMPALPRKWAERPPWKRRPWIPMAACQHASSASLLPEPGPVPPVGLSRVDALGGVAVLHEGRVKPMETFARHILLQFSGRTRYQKSGALEVMSRILFTPELVGDYKIFLINNPEVVQALGVEPEKRRKYSYRQLEKSLDKLQTQAEKADAVEAEKRDLFQKEILRVYGNLVQFVSLTRSMSWALPSRSMPWPFPRPRERLKLPDDPAGFAFWDHMSRAQAISQVLEEVGDRPQASRTPMETEVIALSRSMYLSSQSLVPTPLKVLPSASAPGGWISPPEAVAIPDQLPAFHAELDAWHQAAAAFRKGDAEAFGSAGKALPAAVGERAYEQMAGTHFPLEILYQKGEPFYWALVLYWLALLGTFGYFLVRKGWLYRASLGVFLAGYAIHVAGIVARILIMKRPPVTSLYETFPFVAAVSLLAALVLERIHAKRRSAGIGLLSASLLGVILLSIAGRYAAEGDTMRMLVAVLNSNFWLSTHVVTVTIGYSACLLAGAIGHVYMVRALLPGDESKAERLKEIAKMVYGTVCFGLLFSFVGTVLGGIWADDSWGRFWGWDPKENGALIIVLWNAPCAARPLGLVWSTTAAWPCWHLRRHRGVAGLVRRERARRRPALLRLHRRGRHQAVRLYRRGTAVHGGDGPVAEAGAAQGSPAGLHVPGLPRPGYGLKRSAEMQARYAWVMPSAIGN